MSVQIIKMACFLLLFYMARTFFTSLVTFSFYKQEGCPVHGPKVLPRPRLYRALAVGPWTGHPPKLSPYKILYVSFRTARIATSDHNSQTERNGERIAPGG